MSRFSLARLRSEFAAEWYAIAVMGVIDLVWARQIDFHLLLDGHAAILPAGMLAAYLLRSVAPSNVRLMVEYFCLSLAGTVTLVVFSYLTLASAHGPLVDPALLAADRALGFDWLDLYHRWMAHPLLAEAGRLLYQSMLIQGLYCTILLALLQQRAQMKELWRLTFIASIICCLGGMLFPALGPYKDFGLDSQGAFLPDMERLLSHRDLVFAPGAMTGVVCFPSLHTVMALAYTYGARRTGPIFYLFAVLNFLMLFTIPFFGGHYLADMIAGVAVMLVSLAAARKWGRWQRRALPAMRCGELADESV